ncbi:uncharacterized protein LOC144147015 isoform X2 [Haemaphysalis longicornis]
MGTFNCVAYFEQFIRPLFISADSTLVDIQEPFFTKFLGLEMAERILIQVLVEALDPEHEGQAFLVQLAVPLLCRMEPTGRKRYRAFLAILLPVGRTAPTPYGDASTVRTTGLAGSKCTSTVPLVMSSLLRWKAKSCSFQAHCCPSRSRRWSGCRCDDRFGRKLL